MPARHSGHTNRTAADRVEMVTAMPVGVRTRSCRCEWDQVRFPATAGSRSGGEPDFAGLASSPGGVAHVASRWNPAAGASGCAGRRQERGGVLDWTRPHGPQWRSGPHGPGCLLPDQSDDVGAPHPFSIVALKAAPGVVDRTGQATPGANRFQPVVRISARDAERSTATPGRSARRCRTRRHRHRRSW